MIIKYKIFVFININSRIFMYLIYLLYRLLLYNLLIHIILSPLRFRWFWTYLTDSQTFLCIVLLVLSGCFQTPPQHTPSHFSYFTGTILETFKHFRSLTRGERYFLIFRLFTTLIRNLSIKITWDVPLRFYR